MHCHKKGFLPKYFCSFETVVASRKINHQVELKDTKFVFPVSPSPLVYSGHSLKKKKNPDAVY